jgi:hypothetical protein
MNSDGKENASRIFVKKSGEQPAGRPRWWEVEVIELALVPRQLPKGTEENGEKYRSE